jgi:hypothetical protein
VSNISIALAQSKPSSTVRHLAFGIFFVVAFAVDLAIFNALGVL